MESLLTKGAIAETPPIREGFLQSFVPSPQKGWNFSTCDRLEFPEQVCGKLTLPDGKHSLPKVSTSKGRLYDHSRSERCLSVSPSPQGLTKVSSIPLERQMLRLPRPLFWLKYCTRDLHQTFKTCSSIPSQTGCSYDTLSGRLPNLGVNLPGGAESHSSGCIPPGKPRLHYQSGKVTSNPNPNNNIPGFCNRLHCRNTKPPTGESCKGEIPLHEGIRNSNYVCSSNSKFTRHSRVVSPSNLASPPSFPILADQNDPSSARTRQVEHHCRLRVEGVQRQQRVEDRPSNDFPISEGVQNRPVCLSPIHPTSPVRQLASGSRGTACGCVHNGLGTLQGLRLSTLQSDSSRPKQTVSGQSRHHISGTHLASSTMVATTTEPPGRATCPPPELQTPPEGPSRPSEDSSNVPQTTLSRVSCLRGQYQTMGIPDNVTEILLSASRPSTRKTYQSAWRRWSGWCVKRKTDPLSAPLTDILLYLTEYFNSGAAYRSVNVARSAISTSHTKLNGLPVGQNPLVIQLLKGMFNNRPPKPRYSHTWEVSLATTYLASLGSNRSLSLKQLSWKLAMLFSLTCRERVSALTKLDLRHCRILPDGVEFILSSPRKRGTADQLPKAFFARFPSNSKLCPVETLRCYLKATRSVRPAIPSSKPDPLFISYVKPHKPISAPSLARWLRSLLKASGVNSDIFKAHSVRGASTTAAANSNVLLSEILKMADWSSPSTFQKFYYKPVHSSTFAHAALH